MFSSLASILSAFPADGVDLTVVHDQSVRMCSLPAWVCVGTETGMYQRNGGLIVRALKIREKCTKLSNQEHTFVDDGTAAHGTYVGVVITLLKFTAGNCTAYGQFQAFPYPQVS